MFGLDDLFGVGASLLGGIFNNDSADSRQQDANAFSAQQFASRYQTTVKDMTAAGLNPGLAYGGISGNAPTGAIASPGGMPDLGASFSHNRQASAQNRLATAQVANVEADTANKGAQARLWESQATANLASAGQADANTTLIGQNVQKIKSEIPLLQSQTRNADEQRYVINRTVDVLAEQAKLYAQQGMTQDQVRSHLRAQIGKLVSETSLNELDLAAADKLDNVGRELGQLKPFFDIIRSIVGHRR